MADLDFEQNFAALQDSIRKSLERAEPPPPESGGLPPPPPPGPPPGPAPPGNGPPGPPPGAPGQDAGGGATSSSGGGGISAAWANAGGAAVSGKDDDQGECENMRIHAESLAQAQRAEAEAARQESGVSNVPLAFRKRMAQQAAAAAGGGASGDPSACGGGSMMAAQAPVSPQMLAAQNATLDAYQAQYLRQAQFLQQLRQDEDGKSSSHRFRDDFRPIQICRQLMQRGICKRGFDCTFAHSFDELHPSVSEKINFDGSENPGAALAEQTQLAVSRDGHPEKGPMKLRSKRDLCRRFQKGECLLGTTCMSAHSEKELGEVHLVYVVPVRGALCKFWSEGRCVYHPCQNAHGEHEIGTVKPPKTPTAPAMKKARES